MAEPTSRAGDADGVRSVLYVDLDGSLVATDLLFELVFVLLRRHPWCAPMLPRWLLGGRSGLKAEVAGRVAVEPESLPYNQHVLDLLRERKASGAILVLSTAAPRAWAEAVATHLGLFDAVLATEPGRNLKGLGKLDAIRDDCRGRGLQRFDYVGDTEADLAIWKAAGTAYIVAPTDRLLRRLQSDRPAETVVPVGRVRYPDRAAVRALRPWNWAKNALVFVPMVIAGMVGDPSALARSMVAFVAFCLASSALDVVNDLADLASDRSHPVRRRRPFASGELPPTWGPPMTVALLVTAFVLAALTLPVAFLAAIASFLMVGLAYSLFLKGKFLADAMLLTALDLIRIAAGALAVGAIVPDWLIGVGFLMFLSLAWARRHQERADALAIGPDSVVGASGPSDLRLIETFGPVSGFLAVLLLWLAVSNGAAHEEFRTPVWLWPVCPALLAWIVRIWSLAMRRALPCDPIVFALRDTPSIALFLFVAACLSAAALLT